jgi:hypothetical protein
MFVGLWIAACLTYAVGITYFPLFEYSEDEAPTFANSLFWRGPWSVCHRRSSDHAAAK